VENTAVEFDTDTLQPTYRLHYGIPGASHAFTIARRIGLPDPVLDAAENYLGQGERDGVAIIERLQTLRSTLDEELNKVRHLRAAAEAEQQRIHDERDQLELQRQAVLEEARGQGVQLLAAAEEKLQALFLQLPEGSVQSRQRAELTSQVRSLHDTLPEPLAAGPEQVPEDVAVHEKLYVPALGIEAEVTRVDGERIELMAGGKKLRQPRTALRQFRPRRYAVQKKQVPRIRDRVERHAFLPRLVLVGKRVEDARGLLGRFLDEALLHGEQQLEIVHGAGQGILRRAVREFLAERNEVAVFRAAGAEQGGDNVTLVELRH
jgi:DNA mismatch repair protein MutS2